MLRLRLTPPSWRVVVRCVTYPETANNFNNCVAHTASVVKNLYTPPVCAFRIGNASDDDSPAWRSESQPSRDLRLKLTQRYIVLGRCRQVSYKHSWWLQPCEQHSCWSHLRFPCTGNGSDDDSPAWRRESQPSRDLGLKLTHLCIVLRRRRQMTYDLWRLKPREQHSCWGHSRCECLNVNITLSWRAYKILTGKYDPTLPSILHCNINSTTRGNPLKLCKYRPKYNLSK